MPRDERARLSRDTTIDLFSPGGPGGQHKNKAQTGVRLHHLPTGIRVTAGERRSLSQNLAAAFARLSKALARRATKPKPRKPTKVPQSEKRRRTDEKRARSTRKRTRSRIHDDD